MPRLDTRLCMLLSITTLVVSDLIEDDETPLQHKLNNQTIENNKETRRRDLVSCLQSLGDYQSLLTPPPLVVSDANQAAAKAMMFTSGINIGSSAYLDFIDIKDMPINFCKSHKSLLEQKKKKKLYSLILFFFHCVLSG